ncbi:DUF4174 domain-containing protein [Costertonia aggregata]|uniref:DUF4174 domain-containing protein n=1 Tax=Costertonia aggregata TaxID=343403 RepID=A0A7H9ALP7_9FLAO|nr:DUF4174 domain-containing protein [Costertonia aggregata]QLG44303.1 DUF4174 domain-containing protein [Costertonia aggregata]
MGQAFSDYKWKNRILLLVDSVKTDILTSQLEQFGKLEDEIQERDLIVFLVLKDRVALPNGKNSKIRAKEIYDVFDIESTFKGVALLGKDSGLKFKESFTVKPQRIFDFIDSMPMRKSEMKHDD